MHPIRRKAQPVAILMTVLTLLLSVPYQAAVAALVETEAMLDISRSQEARETLKHFMTREDVQTAIAAQGVDPLEAGDWLAGQVAGGCNVVTFTTGRGSAYGCKPAPSIKLATNSEMYNRMSEDMDINCGEVLEGVTLEELEDLARSDDEPASGPGNQ